MPDCILQCSSGFQISVLVDLLRKWILLVYLNFCYNLVCLSLTLQLKSPGEATILVSSYKLQQLYWNLKQLRINQSFLKCYAATASV